MARSRITVDVDPELRRRIRLAVAQRDETIKDFVERVILRELEAEEGNIREATLAEETIATHEIGEEGA